MKETQTAEASDVQKGQYMDSAGEPNPVAGTVSGRVEETNGGKTQCEEIEIIDSEDEVDRDNPAAFVEEQSLKQSLNAVYPENGPSLSSHQVLNIAPAEGQTPTSIFYQDFWETMAFPTLFPSGKNTFHEKRPVPVTPKFIVFILFFFKFPAISFSFLTHNPSA